MRESVRLTRAEYNDLNNAFDAVLAAAHNLDHGSPEMIETLRKANDLAPDVADALHRISRVPEM